MYKIEIIANSDSESSDVHRPMDFEERAVCIASWSLYDLASQSEHESSW